MTQLKYLFYILLCTSLRWHNDIEITIIALLDYSYMEQPTRTIKLQFPWHNDIEITIIALLDYSYMEQPTRTIKLQFPLFLATACTI